jgi:hypothetical protein
LAPTITREQLGHEIDLSTVDFEYIAQHEQGTTSGMLAGRVPLEPAKAAGTGTVHDPEMVALDEVIANDLVRHHIAPLTGAEIEPGVVVIRPPIEDMVITHPPLEQIPVLPPEALIPPQDISPGFSDGGPPPD